MYLCIVAITAVVDLSSWVCGGDVPDKGIIEEWAESTPVKSAPLRDNEDPDANWKNPVRAEEVAGQEPRESPKHVEAVGCAWKAYTLPCREKGQTETAA